MPNKGWLHFKLCITLILSVCYVSGQLILSHFTHALTLQFAAYHMLCNIVALAGRIITIKKNEDPLIRQIDDNIITGHNNTTTPKVNESKKTKKDDENSGFMKFTRTIALPLTERNNIEHTFRNTFGWVRIDCLFMSVCFIFLASFSIVHATEVFKVLLHMDHKHTPHYPELILLYCFIGLIINILIYLLIGGYTINQSNFFHINSNGNVILNHIDDDKNHISNNNSTISKINIEKNNNGNDDIKQSYNSNLNDKKFHQKLLDIIRDISSLIFVLISACVIFYTNNDIAKYVDPILSLISCFVLIFLNYSYMRESCLVLLQTIPGSIDIENFQNKLLTKFNEIVKLHDFHIWSLTTNKYVSTVHIIFKNPEAYLKIMSDVEKFFRDQGITIVTIQPEFERQSLTLMPDECLISCNNLECIEKTCCQSQPDLKGLTINDLNKKSKHINNDLKNKKHFRKISVNSLQEIHTNSKYLTNGNINNNNNNGDNMKKFASDSQISACTTSTNVSVTHDPDSRNSYENNNNNNTNTISINNLSVTSSNEHFSQL